MSADLHDRLDLSFGEGPEHRPVSDRLLAGRRSLRRRRAATGLVAVGAVTVVAVAPAALGARHHGRGAGGDDGRTAVSSRSEHAIELPVAPRAQVDSSTAPLVILHGTLFRRDRSVTVVRLQRLHVGKEPAAAAVVHLGKTVRWVLVVGSPTEGLSVTSPPHLQGVAFPAWVEAQKPSRSLLGQGATDGVPGVIAREQSPVRFAGERLAAKAGATITQRLEHPAYSDQAIPPGCAVEAVAVSDADGDFYVLGYTCPDGTWDLFTEPAGQRADTLAAWLDAVKAAQDGGAGVR
jgi:hypothetical protein